ncbi:hypothetical protein Tco_0909159 [Tanacetum coccineum]|uniref:Transposase MuDR plant domain-containing protein n=1 Tax=Tanacetum coccineum TaxID=301880 RepID=A0ABQ5CWF8_9ASTR
MSDHVTIHAPPDFDIIINDATVYAPLDVDVLYALGCRSIAAYVKKVFEYLNMKLLTVTLHHDGVFVPKPLKEITSDDDMDDFVKVGFENGFKVDLYHEYNDYDVMAYTTNDNLFPNEDDNLGDDETVVEKEKYPENIDFHTEGEENVVLEKLPIIDPFLTKLVDLKFKAQTYVQYPSYNPDLPWKEFMPVLGMKFENPQQLKHALADYGVVNGYQLWYYRSGGNNLLIYCGTDVDMGRCAGRRVIRKKKKEQQKQKANGKGVMPANQTVQPTSKIKWTRMRVQEHKCKLCPFRIWATWMSSEKSFQIKSLYPDHRCTRNYNLGSLVAFKWIARHYVNEIVMNPSLTYRFMREDIREKFMIDGLIEHYGRLWEYRQAVLESNPGSTCHLDVDFNDDGQPV